MSRKKRIKFLRSAIAAVAVICLVWLGSARASQEQNAQESSGFSAAQKLEGRWVREQGGYVLVLQDIMPDGSLKAFYLNPRNINVHVANWKFEDERLFLYVEMRDVNYPGSTYQLVYNTEKDILEGIYYQAVARQEFEIYFERIR